jgi:Peptidase M61 N-terminal domain
MVRSTAALVLAAAAAESLGAQTSRVSAPLAGISYEITADSAAVGRHQLGVAMSFRVASNAPVILALPAWSPGHYTMLWFARRVSNFSAQSGSAPLDWRKLDFGGKSSRVRQERFA